MTAEDLMGTRDFSKICSAVCTQQIQIDLTVFGMVVALLIGIFWYKHRKMDLHSPTIMRGYLFIQIILLVLFLFTIVGNKRGLSCGSGCDQNSVRIEMTVFPKNVTDIAKRFIGISN